MNSTFTAVTLLSEYYRNSNLHTWMWQKCGISKTISSKNLFQFINFFIVSKEICHNWRILNMPESHPVRLKTNTVILKKIDISYNFFV